MLNLATILESGPHRDDELTDLESRFIESHAKYTDLCRRVRLKHGDVTGGPRDLKKMLYLPPFPELLDEPNKLREDRHSLLRKLCQQRQQPAPLSLHAEQIRFAVQEAAVPTNSLELMRLQLYDFFTRDRAALQTERVLISSRFNRYVRDSAGTHRVAQLLGDRLGRLQQDLEMAESRLSRIKPAAPTKQNKKSSTGPIAAASTGENLFFSNTDYNESTLSCIFRGDVVACIRQTLFEEKSTRILRRFLQKMQHLPFTHRNAIWRKTLEIRGAVDRVAEDTALSEAPLPLVVVSRRRLEAALHDLGDELNIDESLTTDEGRNFAHQVTMDFSHIFARQEAGMQFAPYPSMPEGCASNLPRGDIWGPAHASETDAAVSVGSPSGDTDTLKKNIVQQPNGLGPRSILLKPSPWRSLTIFQPQVDPAILEQRHLLQLEQPSTDQGTAAGRSFSKGDAGAQVPAGATATYAAAAIVESLNTELAALKNSELKQAQERLKTLADERQKTIHEFKNASRSSAASPTSEASHGSGIPSGFTGKEAPAHLLCAYFKIRHLRCRELRRSLLGLANLFRYTQQKLSYETLVAQLPPESAGSDKKDAVDPQIPGRASSASPQSPLSPGSAKSAKSKSFGSPPGGASAGAKPETLPYSAPILPTGGDYHAGVLSQDVHKAFRLLSGSERLESGEDEVRVVDGTGLPIMHEAALSDLDLLEQEMVRTASYFVHKYESQCAAQKQAPADHGGVLMDLYICEVGFHQAKWRLIESYLEIFEHTADLKERRDVAQRTADVMAERPHLDLSQAHFVDAYSSAIALMTERADLLRKVLTHQITTEKRVAAHMSEHQWRLGRLKPEVSAQETTEREEDEQDLDNFEGELVLEDPQLDLGHGLASAFEGCPHPAANEEMVHFVPSGVKTGLFEFCRSACLSWKVDLLAMDAHRHMVDHLHPTQQQLPALQRACYSIMAEEWTRHTRDSLVHFMAPTAESGDVLNFGANAEDPAQLGLLVERKIDQLRASRDAERSDSKRSSHLAPVSEGDEGEELDANFPFADLLERPADEMALRMYLNLLEHCRLREWLSDFVLENRLLEAVLLEQAKAVGSNVAIRVDPVPEFGEFPSEPKDSSKEAKDSKGERIPPHFLAGDVDLEFGAIDLSSDAGIVLNCSNSRIEEMRMIYQHELANRWLYVSCVIHNAILIDDPMRKTIVADVARYWQPDETLLNSDRQLMIFKRLRHAADISVTTPPPVRQFVEKECRPSEQKVPLELSKMSYFLTFPVSNKGMIRLGVGQLFRERSGMVKKQIASLSKGEAALWLRRYKLRLLNYCNVFIGQVTCDISVRVQAALVAFRFRSMAALIPPEFTPFALSTDEDEKPFLDREGGVSSIFCVPQVREVLQMRGTNIKCADVARGIMEVDASLPDAFDGKTKMDCSMVARLLTDYRGSAFLVLVLLHNFLPLVSLLFFFSGLEGNQNVILRLHHAVKSSLADRDSVTRAAKETLAHVEDDKKTPAALTWDALENLRVEFMNFQGQLKGKESNPAAMLSLLNRRLKSSYFKVSLLLRQSAHEALSQGEYEDLAILQGWMRYLDGSSIQGGGEMVVTGLFTGGIAESATFKDSSEETGADEALRRITMLSPPGEPDMTGLHMDFSRYSSEVKPPRPDLPYLHPYIHGLMTVHVKNQNPEDDASHGTEYLSSASPPSAFKGRLPWLFPEVPLLHFSRALCLLSQKHRDSVCRNHIQLEMKAEEYFLLREVTASSPASLEAEIELFRTLLVRENLKESILSAHLRSIAPVASNPQDLARYDAHFSSYFAMERTEEKSDQVSVHDSGATGGKSAVKSSAEDRARAAIRIEMRNAYEQITRLISVFCKMLLSFSDTACRRQLEAVTLTLDEGDQAKSSPVMGKESRGGSGGVSKVEAALTFVNRLRARGTHVRTHGKLGKGESQRAYVFTERDVDEVIEELGRRLLTWGHKAVLAQKTQAQTRIAVLRETVESLEQRVLQNDLDRHRQREWVESQITTIVADRNHKLVFEVDRLHRVAEEMMSASREMEYRLNSEIRHDVLSEIDLLEKEVSAAQDCYYDYRQDLHLEMKEELRALRSDITAQLQQMGVTNYVLQQKVKVFQDAAKEEDAAEGKSSDKATASSNLLMGKAMAAAKENPAAPSPTKTKWLGDDPDDSKKKRPVVTIRGSEQGPDENVEGLLSDIQELKYMQVRCRTFQKLKFQTLRQEFEQLIQALAMTLSSNSELWERVSEIRERERLVEDELTRSNQQKQHHEGTIERLHEQVDFNNDQRQKLQAWRKKKEQRLDAMEAEVKKYQQLGSINIERLLLELSKRDTTLRALKGGGASSEDREMAESDKFSKHRQQIKQQIREAKKHTEAAEAKAELVRSELEKGGVEQDSLVMLWHERWAETTKRAADMENENAELRSRHKGKRGRGIGGLQDLSRDLDLSALTAGSSGDTKTPRGGSAPSVPAHSTEFEEMAAFAVGLSVVPRQPLQRRQIDRVNQIMAPPLKPSPPLKPIPKSPAKARREDVLAVHQSLRDLAGPSRSPVDKRSRGERVADIVSGPMSARSRTSNFSDSGSPGQTQSSGFAVTKQDSIRPTYGLSGGGNTLVPQLLPKQVTKQRSERNSGATTGATSLQASPKREGKSPPRRSGTVSMPAKMGSAARRSIA